VLLVKVSEVGLGRGVTEDLVRVNVRPGNHGPELDSDTVEPPFQCSSERRVQASSRTAIRSYLEALYDIG
jgi:hypothetical protein